MIKLVYCIRRHPSMSREEFQHYWKTNHAELIKSQAAVLGADRYVQSHTIDSPIADAGNQARDSKLEPFDGITEFWWQSEESFAPPGISREQVIDTQKKLLEDELNFIDVANSVLFVTEEFPIFEH